MSALQSETEHINQQGIVHTLLANYQVKMSS